MTYDIYGEGVIDGGWTEFDDRFEANDGKDALRQFMECYDLNEKDVSEMLIRIEKA